MSKGPEIRGAKQGKTRACASDAGAVTAVGRAETANVGRRERGGAKEGLGGGHGFEGAEAAGPRRG